MKTRIVISLLGAVIIVLAGYKLYPFFPVPSNLTDDDNDFVTSQAKKQLFFSVVIENYFPNARPQHGLSYADIVFETLAESGITRYLAFYTSDAVVAKIGPVRSARPYFVDLALGMNSLFAHSGVSLEAEAKINSRTSELKDLDEYFNSQYFWRDGSRKAPHNLYTSTDLLKQAAIDKSWQANGDLGWAYNSKDMKSATSTVSLVEIDFSYPDYFVSFKYDAQRNSYNRFLGGKTDIDANNNVQISPKNIVVLYTTSSLVDQKLLTIDIQTLGSGRAVIFRNGQTLQGRWKKDSISSPLRLLDADDTLIKLNAGQTWIAMIDQSGHLNFE